MKFSVQGQAFTPVPTVFLKEYMCSAPQDYVKVYLYGLCLAYEGGGMDEVDVEEALHLSQAQIQAAFQYWLARGLVQVDQDHSVSYCVSAAGQKEPVPQPQDSPMYRHAAYHRQLEKLMGRRLTPTELENIHDFTDVFTLPHDVVLYLIEDCVQKKGNSVSVAYLNKVAQSWAERGVVTVERAREYVQDHSAAVMGARELLRRMGISGKLPDKTQMDLYVKWTQKWGFSQEAIQYAMRDVEFPSGSPFKYLDAILRSLYERGVTTSSDISQYNEQYERRINNIKKILQALDYKRMSIRPSQERVYDEWMRAGYPMEHILLACAQAVDNGSPNFKAVDALMKEWSQLGLNTEDEIKKNIKKQDRQLKRIEQVYGSAGIKKQIGDADRKWYQNCRTEYKMNHDVLMYAAEISSLANEPSSFLRKVISDWAKKGVTTLKAAMEQNLNRFSGDMKNGKAFEQHNYSEDDLERQKRDALELLEKPDG